MRHPRRKTTPGPGGSLDIIRKNVALASNHAKASASSIYTDASYSPDKAIDGDHRGLNWAKGGGWNGAGPTNNDWLQIDSTAAKLLMRSMSSCSRTIMPVQSNPTFLQHFLSSACAA